MADDVTIQIGGNAAGVSAAATQANAALGSINAILDSLGVAVSTNENRWAMLAASLGNMDDASAAAGAGGGGGSSVSSSSSYTAHAALGGVHIYGANAMEVESAIAAANKAAGESAALLLHQPGGFRQFGQVGSR